MENADDRVVRGREKAAVSFLRLLELRRAHGLWGVDSALRIECGRLVLMLLLTGKDIHRSANKALLLLLLIRHISGDALGSLTLLVKCNIEVQFV